MPVYGIWGLSVPTKWQFLFTLQMIHRKEIQWWTLAGCNGLTRANLDSPRRSPWLGDRTASPPISGLRAVPKEAGGKRTIWKYCDSANKTMQLWTHSSYLKKKNNNQHELWTTIEQTKWKNINTAGCKKKCNVGEVINKMVNTDETPFKKENTSVCLIEQ